MRVLHVAPSVAAAYGGPTQSLRGFLMASRAAGIEAHVAAPRAPSADARQIRDIAGGPALHEFGYVGHGAAVVSPGLLYWLLRNVRAYDVLHVHGLLNSVSSASARIGLATGVPTIVRPFGTLSRYTATYRRAAFKALYFKVVDRPNLRRVAAVHFTSEQERDEAAWHGTDISAAGRVIPPPYIGDQPRAELAPSGRYGVLFVGRLHPIKNLESLIAAWPDVLRRAPAATLILAGTGARAYERELREQVRVRGVGDSVAFAGFADAATKERLFADAALFVLPSHHENFGMAALEATAHGLPVIISHGAHISRFISTHRLGVVSSAEAADLAQAIVGGLADGDLRTRCASQGPELVRRLYAPSVIGAQLRELYETVLVR